MAPVMLLAKKSCNRSGVSGSVRCVGRIMVALVLPFVETLRQLRRAMLVSVYGRVISYLFRIMVALMSVKRPQRERC